MCVLPLSSLKTQEPSTLKGCKFMGVYTRDFGPEYWNKMASFPVG